MTNDSQDLPKGLVTWGFDQWQHLYKKDPNLYEHYRQKLFLKLIDDAPEHQKERLKGLLFTMQGEKRRSRSIEAEQARYYALMMDSLVELNAQISSLMDTNDVKERTKLESAQILQFKMKNS